MTQPITITLDQSVELSNAYQAVLNTFANVMASAQAFETAANRLAANEFFLPAANPNFVTWGSARLAEISYFVQNTPPPPAG